MKWRWDQGRLEYFRFDAVRTIARILITLDGIRFNDKVDILRTLLMEEAGMPFAPSHYMVWRNYGRVFGCQLLATQIDNRLVCTQLCHELGKSTGKISNVDDYLTHFTKIMYYPSPVFEGYRNDGPQVFPICAILKLLCSKVMTGGSNHITIDEIFGIIIANGCTGKEPLSHYLTLSPKSISPSADEKRQVRELVIFVSQFSFLKWDNPKLFLDVLSFTTEFFKEIESFATPILMPRNKDRKHELLALGKLPEATFLIPEMKERINTEDEEFVEGRKVRVTHLRTERSRKLRELFFSSITPPYLCDVCEVDMKEMYPWTKNLLQLHHLLPLSSPIKVEIGKTSIKDLVELCPNCHHATHNYYRLWLKKSKIDDFRSYDEVHVVYEEVKASVVM